MKNSTSAVGILAIYGAEDVKSASCSGQDQVGLVSSFKSDFSGAFGRLPITPLISIL
jgi:hypothetical protein